MSYKNRKYAATEEELEELMYLYEDSAGLLSKIKDRGKSEEHWIMAHPGDGDLGGFLASQLKHGSLPIGCLELGQGLWGDAKEVQTIYVRDWYKQTATEIVKSFTELSPCIVAGSGGMGKSVFGLVLLLQALDAGLDVTYQKGTKRFWIVSSRKVANNKVRRLRVDSDDDDDSWLDEITDPISKSKKRKHRHWPVLTPGVYRASQSDVELFEELSIQPQVMHIVDIDDSVECEINPFGRKVIISSPNSSKLMRIGEFHNPTYKYMPLWTLEELQTLNEKLPVGDTKVPNPIYHRLSAEALKELYEKFGGVPRVLFKNESVEDKCDRLQKAIRCTSFEVLKEAFYVQSYTDLSHTTPDSLVYFREAPNRPKMCIGEFISKYVHTCYFTERPEKFVPFENLLAKLKREHSWKAPAQEQQSE